MNIIQKIYVASVLAILSLSLYVAVGPSLFQVIVIMLSFIGFLFLVLILLILLYFRLDNVKWDSGLKKRNPEEART